MAKFSFNGIDTLTATFDQTSQLTDEDKLAVIMPAAELLKEKHSEKIRQVFTQRSGALAKSIEITVKSGDGGSYAHISPKGKHPKSSTGKRKRRNGRPGSNGRYSGSNAEVAYILEYGSPRITARHWMETANEEAEQEIADTQQRAFDDVLQKKGLI